ncbi:MAG: acyltransferase family protein [Microthrixaceae bacterium]
MTAASVEPPTRLESDHASIPPVTSPRRPVGDSLPGRIPHLRALDGLRGLAVLLVLLSHFSPDIAPGGFLGVDLFFLLSGFLITSLLVAEVESSGAVSLRGFWLRRARRLFPALLAVVGAVLAVTWMAAPDDEVHRVGADGLAAVFYVANWRFIVSGESYIRQFLDSAPSPLRHTWSLAIEEQFYLVWPLVVLGVITVLGRHQYRTYLRRWLMLLSMSLAVVSFGALVLQHRGGAGLDRLYYGTDSRIFIILVGAALGAITGGIPTITSPRARSLVIGAGLFGAAALCVATARVTTEQTWLYAGGFGLVALTLLVVLVAAAQPGTNPLAWFLQLKPLVGLGLISYGLYLWHWPIAVWFSEERTGMDGIGLFALRCGLTLGVSLLSYRFLEQPIRRGTLPRLGPIGPAFTSIGIVVGIVVSLAIPVLVYPGVKQIPTDAPAEVTGSSVGTADAYARAVRCDGPPATEPIRVERLVVQLEGNSLAGEVANCLGEILDSRGADIIRVNPPDFLLCRELPSIEDQVREEQPDVAVVFLFAAYDDRCGRPWNLVIDRLMEIYTRFDVHVYLVPSVPVVKGGRDELAPGPLLEDEYYRKLAAAEPDRFTYVDAGVFLRDDAGEYRWTMPCLSDDEPGCSPDGTVGVRFVDGVHFCTDPEFAARGCVGEEYQAGQRRATAGIAATLLPSLQERFG